MRIDGKCHCGGISFEADIDPARVVICHCTDCQTISGAPYRVNVPVMASRIHLDGSPTPYRKVGDSGRAVVTNFCGVCGTSLFSHRADDPDHVFLRIGCVTQRADLPPMVQGFCRSAMPWALDIREVPEAPARPPATA